MIRIRRFEEKCAELYGAGKIRGFLHLYIGEEAIAAGVMPLLAADDAVVSTYREHGHALARGVPASAVMAEMFGKVEGCSRGRGGSMHLFDVSRRFYGGNAIVAGGIPIAVGLALADKMQRRNARHGVLLRRRRRGRGRVPRVDEPRRAVEAAGALSLREQPVRDGHRARAAPVASRTSRSRRRATRCTPSASTAWTSSPCEAAVASRDRARARQASGPCFLELVTYRFRAHSMYDPELYRAEGGGEALEASAIRSRSS